MTANRTSPAALTWSGVTARRMARHLLAEPATGLDPAGVAGVLCGAHAQGRSGRKLTITVEPLRGLTAPQRRQLDDEAALVGAIMDAAATLTVGTVTAGAHA